MSANFSSEPQTTLPRIVQPFLALVAGIVCAANAQSPTPASGLNSRGEIRLLQSDLAVLELQKPRRDLRCVVTAPRPELGFDFMFHAGFEVRVPVREVAGDGNELTIVLRVFPQDRPNHPTYMVGRVPVPMIEEHGSGESKLYGFFALGEGRYHVDWLMRDQRERICAKSWDLEARLDSKDSQLRQWIPQALIEPRRPLFASEPPVDLAPENGSPRVSIIVNFNPSDPSAALIPSDPSAALIDDPDLDGLVALLRRMGRDPRVVPYSILICSLETQQVVYQQENKSDIDLPALGKALGLIKLGTVDAKRLLSTKGAAQFAADLIREQLRKDNSDALVVVGPKGGSEMEVSRQALESFEKPDKPAFYLSFDTKRQSSLWRDPISSIMKRLHGFQYSINRPKDFFNAWADVVSRIVRTKQTFQVSLDATAVAQ